jgi:hypothetical protein
MDGSRDRLHDAPQPRNFFGDPLLSPAVFERTELLHHDPDIDLDGQAYARGSYLLSRSEGRRTLLRAPFESATQAHGALSAAEARSASWSCPQTATRTDQLTVATDVASVAGTIGKGR